MKTPKTKKRFVLLCALTVLLALIIWTAWGNTALMVNTITVSSDRIPAGFSGYRIAQVSDLHNQGFFPKYDAGLYTDVNTNMVVSRGIGNSIIPFRFNNRPEVVLVELRAES